MGLGDVAVDAAFRAQDGKWCLRGRG
jgi:hypothetical protein